MAARRTYLPLWLEAFGRALARLLYRVRTAGAETFPAEGGVVLVSNHLSYVDVVILQMACPRPLRYLAFRGSEPHPFFDWIFRTAGVIPISETNAVGAVRSAVAALSRGEVVCVFPEGSISRTGQLMHLRAGFEVMARRSGARVVPVAIDGLWGSIFSFSGHRYLWKRPRLLPTPVAVHFGAPLAAAEAQVAGVRQALLDLGAEAFAERPLLRRHLGREVVRALARRPGRVVVVDRTAERRELKAAQLIGAAAVLARWLRRQVPEKRVGIVLPPGLGALIANLAALCAGKTPVNLNFTASRPAIEASLRLGGVRTVISAEAMREKVPHFPWPERTFDLRSVLLEAGGKRAMAPWLLAAWILPNQWVANLLGLPRGGGDAEAGLLFTSGTAGDAKGVPLSHRNILANCDQVSSLSILPRSCTLLGCLPIFHSFGFTVTVWYPLLLSRGLVTVPSPLDTRKILDAIASEGVTVLVGAPTFLRPVLKKGRPAELRSLNLVVSGAEALPAELQRRFREAFHLDIIQGYGLTETAPISSLNQPHPPIATATAEHQLGKRDGTVGRLMPGMTARILHPETGAELPSGQTGIIALRGANVFRGYLGLDGRIAENGGWFATGDLGSFDLDGFLTIAGRLARFSKIGGELVPHAAVERALAEALRLDESDDPVFAVTAVPDAAKGEALVLLSARELTAETVRETLHAAGLPALWIPKRVVRLEKLPLLGSGKLDLRGCREAALAARPPAP